MDDDKVPLTNRIKQSPSEEFEEQLLESVALHSPLRSSSPGSLQDPSMRLGMGGTHVHMQYNNVRRWISVFIMSLVIWTIVLVIILNNHHPSSSSPQSAADMSWHYAERYPELFGLGSTAADGSSEGSNKFRIGWEDAVGMSSGQFIAKSKEFNWVPVQPGQDGSRKTGALFLEYDEEKGIILHDLNNASGDPAEVLFDSSKLVHPISRTKLYPADIKPSFDLKYLLISDEYTAQHRWRHSSYRKYFILSVAEGKVYPFAYDFALLYAEWVPGTYDIVYEYKNDLYKFSMDIGSNTRLTFDGKEIVVFNGVADWVYEEEVLESVQANWIAPTGSHIAFLQFNDTLVDDYRYPVYSVDGRPAGSPESLYPRILEIKYPKPSRSNPSVTLNVVSLNPPSSNRIKLSFPEEITAQDPIVYQVVWSPDGGSILVKLMNRNQDQQMILKYSLVGGNDPVVLRKEKTEGWFEKSIPLKFISPSEYLDLAVKDDFMHLAVFSTDVAISANPVRYLTSGSSEVTGFLGYASATKTSFFISTQVDSLNPIGNSTQRHVWSVSESLTLKKWSSEGEGYNSATISPDGEWLVIDYQGPQVPHQSIFSTKTGQTSVVEPNSELVELYNEYSSPRKIIADYPISNTAGLKANLRITYPIGFSPDLKSFYPVLVEVYGGPESQKITASWSVGLPEYFASNWHKGTPPPNSPDSQDAIDVSGDDLKKSYSDSTAQPPFIYITMDVRGTGFQGVAYAQCTARHLGEIESTDVVSVIENWVKDHDFVDKEKVAIWGWSYGGYLTSKVVERQALMKRKVFSVAVAVAPVIDWMYYDTVYTERYMKQYKDNQENYTQSAVSTQGVDQVRYLLMHGLADDNVHYQNTADFADRLQQSAHPNMFKIHTAPDNDHGMARTRGSRQFVYDMLRDWVVDGFKEVDRTRWTVWSYFKVTNTALKWPTMNVTQFTEWCQRDHRLC